MKLKLLTVLTSCALGSLPLLYQPLYAQDNGPGGDPNFFGGDPGSGGDDFGDDQGDDETTVCAPFSLTTLLDLGLSGEVELTTFAKKAERLLDGTTDLWVDRELEDEDGSDELLSLAEAINGSLGEESIDDPTDDPLGDIGNDDPSNDPSGNELVSCFSIDDLVNSLLEERCTKAEKKEFKRLLPLLRLAVRASGPFVDNGLEESADAKSLSKKISKLEKRCMPKK